MRKIDAGIDLDLVALTKAHGGTGKIAETIDRNAGRFTEPGNEKGRSQVREVMFDVMHLVLPSKLPPERFYERFAGLYCRVDANARLTWPAVRNLARLVLEGAPRVAFAAVHLDGRVVAVSRGSMTGHWVGVDQYSA